ncbi:MAG TPA: tetratricopeptide repeat protein [Bryobacteraceae bacterium]|nr:tetratricopeptide repeat protein [Bryobacteraceae bacterium]
MRRIPTLSAALLAAAIVLAGTGCSYLKSRDHLNQGIASFRNAKYSDAVEHFEQAIKLDPQWSTPRLYLATSYMVQWIPGAESPENLEFARKAKEEFQKVLDKDANDKNALASLAMLAFNQAQSLPLDQKLKMFDESAKWQRRRIEVDPKEKEAYYSLGVIAYQKWIPALMTARSNLRMRPEDPGPLKDKKVKEELKADYGPIVEEGMQNLNKALEIDPEYDDAMAYLNLLIRERADLLDSPDDYKKQVEVADGWLQKALDTKKIKAARAAKQPTGIHTEN